METKETLYMFIFPNQKETQVKVTQAGTGFII